MVNNNTTQQYLNGTTQIYNQPKGGYTQPNITNEYQDCLARQTEIDAFKIANPNFEDLVRNSTYITQSQPVLKAAPADQPALIEEFVQACIVYATMVANIYGQKYWFNCS